MNSEEEEEEDVWIVSDMPRAMRREDASEENLDENSRGALDVSLHYIYIVLEKTGVSSTRMSIRYERDASGDALNGQKMDEVD